MIFVDMVLSSTKSTSDVEENMSHSDKSLPKGEICKLVLKLVLERHILHLMNINFETFKRLDK